MNKFAAIGMTLTMLATTAHGQNLTGFSDVFDPSNWSTTGIDEGTTEILPAVELTYDVDLTFIGGGVSLRTAEYSSTATGTGLMRVRWIYFAQHSFFQPVYDLIAFADGPGGRVEIPMGHWMDTSSVDEEGFVELQVTAGFDYGFIMGGSNFDTNSTLKGSLTLVQDGGDVAFNNNFSTWTLGGMNGGFSRSRPAIEFKYDVDLGSPGGGVSFRTADFTLSAPESGQFTCDWNVNAIHSFFEPVSEYDLIAQDANGVETVETLFSGDFGSSIISPEGRNATIHVDAGQPLGIRAGGGNFDSNSFIRGSVVLSRMTWEPDVCEADINNDGQLNFFDISEFLSLFSAGCP